MNHGISVGHNEKTMADGTDDNVGNEASASPLLTNSDSVTVQIVPPNKVASWL